jgi:hypothetical protein
LRHFNQAPLISTAMIRLRILSSGVEKNLITINDTMRETKKVTPSSAINIGSSFFFLIRVNGRIIKYYINMANMVKLFLSPENLFSRPLGAAPTSKNTLTKHFCSITLAPL